MPCQPLGLKTAAHQLDGPLLHRCYAKLDPTTTSVAEILTQARDKLSDHLLKRAAYYKLPVPCASDADLMSVWAKAGGDIQRRAILLAGEDSLLSDAVIGHTRETCFGATSPPCDGLYFCVMPSDVSVDLLLDLTSQERTQLIRASPHMRRVWAGYVFFDVPCEELFFEVAELDSL